MAEHARYQFRDAQGLRASITRHTRPKETEMKTEIDPVDLYIGERIRTRRRQLGMSMEAVSAAIDVSWQQLSKYEHGQNRVSCSMLARIANALGVAPAWFFQGAPMMSTVALDPDDTNRQLWLATEDARRWVDAGMQLPPHALDPMLRI